MADRPRQGVPAARVVVPLALLHVVCCGGLVLWPLAGSALLGAIGAYASDPLVQGAALLLLAGTGPAAWRRYRRRREPAAGEAGARPTVLQPARNGRQ